MKLFKNPFMLLGLCFSLLALIRYALPFLDTPFLIMLICFVILAKSADLFVDSADPDRHIEVFMVDSWAEHLRQHERVTALDRVAESRVQACLVEGEYPRVQHFLASRGWRSRLRPRKDGAAG